jgi:hypothetical protein
MVAQHQVGRKRTEGNYTPQQNNSMEDLVGNEENGYPVPDPNKTMITISNEPVIPTKNPSKRKSWKRSWKRY